MNTECKSFKNKEALEKGIKAAKIFNQFIKFKQVSVYTDYSLHQIWNKLKELKELSKINGLSNEKKQENYDHRKKKVEEIVEEKFKIYIEKFHKDL